MLFKYFQVQGVRMCEQEHGLSKKASVKNLFLFFLSLLSSLHASIVVHKKARDHHLRRSCHRLFSITHDNTPKSLPHFSSGSQTAPFTFWQINADKRQPRSIQANHQHRFVDSGLHHEEIKSNSLQYLGGNKQHRTSNYHQIVSAHHAYAHTVTHAHIFMPGNISNSIRDWRMDTIRQTLEFQGLKSVCQNMGKHSSKNCLIAFWYPKTKSNTKNHRQTTIKSPKYIRVWLTRALQ